MSDRSSIVLMAGVYQDGDTFYHEEFGPLVRFPGTVKHSYDVEGARRAREEFARLCPDLVAGEMVLL